MKLEIEIKKITLKKDAIESLFSSYPGPGIYEVTKKGLPSTDMINIYYHVFIDVNGNGMVYMVPKESLEMFEEVKPVEKIEPAIETLAISTAESDNVTESFALKMLLIATTNGHDIKPKDL